MVLSSCGGKLDLQNDGWGVELQMVLGEVEELARDGEQEKSMNRRKVLHNGESLEAIVIEMCLQNRCSRPVLYREYHHAYMNDTWKKYLFYHVAQKRVYLSLYILLFI